MRHKQSRIDVTCVSYMGGETSNRCNRPTSRSGTMMLHLRKTLYGPVEALEKGGYVVGKGLGYRRREPYEAQLSCYRTPRCCLRLGRNRAKKGL